MIFPLRGKSIQIRFLCTLSFWVLSSSRLIVLSTKRFTKILIPLLWRYLCKFSQDLLTKQLIKLHFISTGMKPLFVACMCTGNWIEPSIRLCNHASWKANLLYAFLSKVNKPFLWALLNVFIITVMSTLAFVSLHHQHNVHRSLIGWLRTRVDGFQVSIKSGPLGNTNAIPS